jgi:hypothetical protein
MMFATALIKERKKVKKNNEILTTVVFYAEQSVH